MGVALLAFGIGFSALAFGAQPPAALLAATVSLAAAARLLAGPRTPRATWLLLGLAGYTLFQLVPLPLGMLTWLSPHAAEVWLGAYRLVDAKPAGWLPLSVDPPATALEATKWFGYACVLTAASGLRSRRSATPLAVLLFASALAVCVVTLAHGIVDAQRVYGIYTPPAPGRWLHGPFVNGNNLAGYLNLGIFAGAGLWASQKNSAPPWLFGLGLPAMAASVLLSDSRAGIATLFFGALVFGALLAWRRRVEARHFAFAGILLVVGVGAALVLGSSRLVHTISDRQVEAKVSAWRWSLDLIRDYPVFGVGRGAFETAFEPYRKPLSVNWTTVFSHAENFPLQWLSDWGIPVGVATLGACVWLFLRVLPRARRDPLAAGLFAGLLALFAQNLVDLGLELFAIMAAAFVALSGLDDSNGEERGPLPRSVFAAVGGVLVSLVLVLAMGARPVQMDRQRLAKAYDGWAKARFPDPAGERREVVQAVLRHPGDAYFPLVGSYLVGEKHERPLHWVARALERSPLDARAHLRLSELLLARGARDQAVMHLRLCALYDVTMRDGALGRAAGLQKTADDLRRAFPKDLPGGEFLADVCARLAGDLRLDCWREVVSRETTAPEPRRQLTAALLTSLADGSPACAAETTHCPREIERQLAELEKGPPDFRVTELRARYLAYKGDPTKAAKLLVEHCPASSEAASCCELAFDLAKRSKDLALLGVAADRYAALACTEPDRCAQAHQEIARTYSELGAYALALSHFFDAADRAPSVDHWLDAAEAAVRSSGVSTVRVALERAGREGTLNAEQQRRVSSIENALASTPPPK